MPVKYFCDVCETEVDDPSRSLDMTGKILCSTCFGHYLENNKSYSYKISWDFNKKKNPFKVEKIWHSSTLP